MGSVQRHLSNCHEDLNDTKHYIKCNNSQDITKYIEDSKTYSDKKIKTEAVARETLREVVGTQEGKREATRYNMEY